MFWIGIIVGLFIGGTIGALLMACVTMAKRADERAEAPHHELFLR
jgi:hypothetical protein